MTITFYRTPDDYRKVSKALGTALGTAVGELHERVNDLQFTVRVPSTFYNLITQANIVMIDTFQKYYFLESYEIQNDCVYINLVEDVRMSYATQIRAMTATVNRSASNWQGFLYDQGYQVLAYKTAAIRNFPNAIDNDTMILTTVG